MSLLEQWKIIQRMQGTKNGMQSKPELRLNMLRDESQPTNNPPCLNLSLDPHGSYHQHEVEQHRDVEQAIEICHEAEEGEESIQATASLLFPQLHCFLKKGILLRHALVGIEGLMAQQDEHHKH